MKTNLFRNLGRARRDQNAPKPETPAESAPERSTSTSEQPSLVSSPAKSRTKGLISLKDFSNEEAFDKAVKIDIVALHGLNGHPINTWKDGDTIWFRDFLPDLVPRANLRISTFGYSSEMGPTKSRSEMLDFVLGLLNSLDTLRTSTNTDSIPILFLCHSLGGILFKKSLALAQDREKLYGKLRKSVAGVVFFGTPHAGSKIASWTQILRNIAQVSTAGHVRPELLANLEASATELTEIAASSVERLDDLKIISVYERRALGPLGLIVDRESAVLNVSNERPMPVEANHRDICRFSNADDLQFRPILLAVASLLKDTTFREQNPLYAACLVSLYFKEFQERRLRVSDPYEKTFSWIWSHPRFQEWCISDSSALLWMQGKPASGKSTILNYVRNGLLESSDIEAMLSPELRPERCSSTRSKRHVTVDFFYSVRGGANELQRGHLWMLRSILYQLLLKVPAFWTDFCTFFEQQAQTHGNRPESSRPEINFESKVWSLRDLQTLLISLGSKYHGQDDLVVNILVDAMDESDKEARRNVVNSLLQVGSHEQGWPVTFKVFVASRPDSVFGVVERRCIFMLLEEETMPDIIKLVEGELQRISSEIPSLRRNEFAFLQEELIRKCQGVFLWVRLVLLELENKAQEVGCTVREMEELLNSIPSDLWELYARMHREIEPRSQTLSQIRETNAVFLWTAHAPRNLMLREMREVAAAAACGPIKLTRQEMARNRVGDVDEIKRRIVNRCGNFLEVRAYGNLLRTAKGAEMEVVVKFVQYIHTTALEYMTTPSITSSFSVPDKSVAVANISDLWERYIDFLVAELPNWGDVGDDKMELSVETMQKVDIQHAIGFLNDYQPSLLNFVLGTEPQRYQWKYAYHLLDHTNRERVSAAWRKGNLAFSALYFASLVQRDVNALQVLSECDVVEAIEQNVDVFGIRRVDGILVEHPKDVVLRVCINYVKIGDGSGSLLEATTTLLDHDSCQKLQQAGFFDKIFSHHHRYSDSKHAELLLARATERDDQNFLRLFAERAIGPKRLVSIMDELMPDGGGREARRIFRV